MLLTWNPGNMWYPRGPHTSRRELWIDPARMGTYEDSYPDYTEAPRGEGNCWSSKTTISADDMHLPILDVDSVSSAEDLKRHFDTAFGGAPQIWVPSTNNWHVYIGAGPGQTYNAAIPWETMSRVLEWLADKELVDRGWAYHSRRDEQCIVRKPGIKKGSKVALSCMWCAAELTTEQELEAHEEECS